MWQGLDAKNCWASSRYEYAFIFVLNFTIPMIKFNGFIPMIVMKKFTMNLLINIFTSYPCSLRTTTWFWWFWLSEKLPDGLKEMKEFSFRLEFETTSRIRFIQVLFMIPPFEVKLESS